MVHLLIFLFYLNSHAAVQTDLKAKTCLTPMHKLLESYGSQNQWVPAAPRESNTFLFRSPTKNIGQWVEIETTASEALHKVRFLSQDISKQHIFNEDCSQTFVEKKQAQTPKQNEFYDQDLRKLVNSSRDTLIYLWSPKMVYSVKNSAVFVDVAKKLGLNFVSLVEPNTSKHLMENELKNQFSYLGTMQNKSFDLHMRGAAVHYPSIIIVSHKKLSREPIVGVYTEGLLIAKILSQMDELK